jgi:uncharacterized membrane protein YgcG
MKSFIYLTVYLSVFFTGYGALTVSPECGAAIDNDDNMALKCVQTATNMPKLTADTLFEDPFNPQWGLALSKCTCTPETYKRYQDIGVKCQLNQTELADDQSTLKKACNDAKVNFASISGNAIGGSDGSGNSGGSGGSGGGSSQQSAPSPGGSVKGGSVTVSVNGAITCAVFMFATLQFLI